MNVYPIVSGKYDMLTEDGAKFGVFGRGLKIARVREWDPREASCLSRRDYVKGVFGPASPHMQMKLTPGDIL